MSATKDEKNYFKRVMTAERFTKNQQKAKLMVDGNYKDLLCIKCSFKSDDTETFGHLVIIVNDEKNYLLETFVAIGNYSSFFDNKPASPLFDFMDKITKDIEQNYHDASLSDLMKENIKSNVNDEFITALKVAFKNSDVNLLQDFIIKCIDKIKLSKDNIQIAIEKSTSLEINELYGVNPVEKNEDNSFDDKKDIENSQNKDAIQTIEKDYNNKIVNVKALVRSNGKNIENLKEGDKVFVLIRPENELSKMTAKSMLAIENGKITPLQLTVIKKFTEKNHILVYLKSEEFNDTAETTLFKMKEQKLIKIATEVNNQNVNSKKISTKGNKNLDKLVRNLLALLITSGILLSVIIVIMIILKIMN